MVGSPYVSAVLTLFYAVTTADTVESALTAALKAPEPDICEVGGGGYVFPLFGDDEAGWPKALRGILYGIAVLWCFLGVAIVADLFMAAIEGKAAHSTRARCWAPNAPAPEPAGPAASGDAGEAAGGCRWAGACFAGPGLLGCADGWSDTCSPSASRSWP